MAIKLDRDASLLAFAGLDLMSTDPTGAFTLRALGAEAGTDLGSGPEPITAVMQTFLQDGAAVATTRHDNRTLAVIVKVRAEDSNGLAAGEAALVSACSTTWGTSGMIAELTWTPPAGMGPVCIFECVAARLDREAWDDYEELDPKERGAVYRLTLTCMPWVKSDTTVSLSIPAPTATSPVSPTVTVYDDGTSTTHWTANSGGSLSTSGGYVIGTWNATPATVRYISRDSLSISMGTDPYLLVTAYASRIVGSARFEPIEFVINRTHVVAPVAVSGNQYWLPWSGGVITSVAVRTAAPYFAATKAFVGCHQIATTDMITAGSLTQHEISRFFPVQGSVRAPASIGLNGTDPSSGGTADLGDVLLYTSKADNGAIALKQYAGSGGATDVTAYSGNAWTLSSTMTAMIEYAQLNQAGYAVWARVKATSTGAKTITLKTRSGAATLLTATVTIAVANTWQVVLLGAVALPETVWENAAQNVDFELDSTSLILDDCWLFDVDNGQLTVVGATGNVGLWLDSPTPQNPTPSIFLSSSWTRGMGRQASAEISSWDAHEFDAGGVNVFVAAATPVAVSLSYTPRWHTRAGELAA